MSERASRAASTKGLSDDAYEIVHGGVSVAMLGEIFHLDSRDVKKRLRGKVNPCSGTRDTFLKYRIREAAPYLVEGNVDAEALLQNVQPNKWPPVLQDAFWKAQNNRQKWEENRGDLWRTERIYEVLTEAFKEIRLTILMFADTISQRTELTPEQRRIVQQLGDGLIESLGRRITEHFTFREAAPDEHGESLSEANAKAATPQADDFTDEEEEEVDPFA